jgi:F0F1-type ATP synthase assembly protein I
MPWWVVALRLTGLGWYIAFCVAGGLLLGLWVDNLLGTKLLFFLVGTVLGSVAAFWGIYRMILPILYGAKAQEMARKRRDR